MKSTGESEAVRTKFWQVQPSSKSALAAYPCHDHAEAGRSASPDGQADPAERDAFQQGKHDVDKHDGQAPADADQQRPLRELALGSGPLDQNR